MLFQTSIRWATIALVISLLCAYLAPFVSPQRFWPIAFIGLAYPGLVLGNVLIAGYWLFHRDWRSLLPLGALLLGSQHLLGYFNIHASGTPVPGAATVTVMTYNVQHFRASGDGRIFADPGLWRQVLKKQQPDILCLQEFEYNTRQENNGEGYVKPLAKTFDLQYSHWKREGDLAIFSRYPILRKGSHFFSPSAGYLYADIQYGKEIIRVYNIHLQSNTITGLAHAVAEEGNLKEKKTWVRIRGILGRFRRASRTRALQSEMIAAEFAKSPYPLLVCGDFNDTPLSYAYTHIRGKLTDTFKRAGSGLATTYVGPIPGLRIDYIFTDPAFVVLACQRADPAFSDHRPVISTVVLPTTP